jgi:hypothetical protein
MKILNQLPKVSLVATVIVVTSAVAALGQTPRGCGAKGMQSPIYDTKTEMTISGVVQEVKEVPGPGRSNGLHLVLKGDAATYEVHVGPTWYLSQKKYTFAKGEQIEVTGSKVTCQGSDVVVARQVKKDRNAWMLRDEKGVPLWSRRKNS